MAAWTFFPLFILMIILGIIGMPYSDPARKAEWARRNRARKRASAQVCAPLHRGGRKHPRADAKTVPRWDPTAKWPGDEWDWIMQFAWEDDARANHYPYGRCHREWSTLRRDNEFLMLIATRELYKSTFGLGYVCKTLCEHRDEPVLFGTYIEHDCQSFFDQVVRILQSDEVVNFYGQVIEKVDAGNRTLDVVGKPNEIRDPSLSCITPAKGRMGHHPRHVLFDDIQDQPRAGREFNRIRRLIDRGIILSRRVRGRLRFLVIGTRKDIDDIYAYLQKKKIMRLVTYPYINRVPRPDEFEEIIDEHGVRTGVIVPHPERFTLTYPEGSSVEDFLMIYLAAPDVAASEMMCDPIPAEGKLIKWSRFAPLQAADFCRGLTAAGVAARINGLTLSKTCAWIDWGGRTGHGISMICQGVDSAGRLYIYDCVRLFSSNTDDCVPVLLRWYEDYGLTEVGVENNFGQAALVAGPLQRAVAATGARLWIISIANEGDKVDRIGSIGIRALGPDGTTIRVYYNEEAKNLNDFRYEAGRFGQDDVTEDEKKRFDFLDAWTSCTFHLCLAARGRSRWY